MNPEEMKLGAQQRDAHGAVLSVRAEGEQKKLSFSASSTEPYDRYYGTEVLSHEKSSIRMERFKRGAVPLLFNHNWDDPIGMVTGARVENERLVVDADVFATGRAQEVLSMVEGGLRNVSIGYRVHEFLVNEKEDTYTATDWEPLEISVVTVPADSSVGIGRSEDTAPIAVRKTVSQPATQVAFKEQAKMAETQAAAGENAEVKNILPAEVEAKRKEAIVNLCRANRIDERI